MHRSALLRSAPLQNSIAIHPHFTHATRAHTECSYSYTLSRASLAAAARIAGDRSPIAQTPARPSAAHSRPTRAPGTLGRRSPPQRASRASPSARLSELAGIRPFARDALIGLTSEPTQWNRLVRSRKRRTSTRKWKWSGEHEADLRNMKPRLRHENERSVRNCECSARRPKMDETIRDTWWSGGDGEDTAATCIETREH